MRGAIHEGLQYPLYTMAPTKIVLLTIVFVISFFNNVVGKNLTLECYESNMCKGTSCMRETTNGCKSCLKVKIDTSSYHNVTYFCALDSCGEQRLPVKDDCEKPGNWTKTGAVTLCCCEGNLCNGGTGLLPNAGPYALLLALGVVMTRAVFL